MRKVLWIILGVCLVVAIGGPAPSLLEGPDAADDVVILIVDDFAYKAHGASVERVARLWNPAGAEIRAIYAMNTFDGYLTGVREALSYVAENPHKKCIVNLSLGHPSPRPEEKRLFERLAGHGAVVVASAGNESTDLPYYPAAYPSVVSVAAADGPWKADYSNYGRHVDLTVQPHELLHVEVAHHWTPDGLIVHETVRTEAGTSLAAPKLAGLLASQWAHRPELSSEELVDRLSGHCRSMDDPYYLRGQLGAGLLNERDMLMAVPRYAARYWLVVASAFSTAAAASFLILAMLLLGPKLASQVTTALLAATLAIVLITADMPWLLRWGWIVQACLAATSAAVLWSAAAKWPWPLGGVRVHVFCRPGLEDYAERVMRRLRRLGADARCDPPVSLAHGVLRLEPTADGVIWRMGVREGMHYRLHEFPGRGAHPPAGAVELLRPGDHEPRRTDESWE